MVLAFSEKGKGRTHTHTHTLPVLLCVPLCFPPHPFHHSRTRRSRPRSPQVEKVQRRLSSYHAECDAITSFYGPLVKARPGSGENLEKKPLHHSQLVGLFESSIDHQTVVRPLRNQQIRHGRDNSEGSRKPSGNQALGVLGWGIPSREAPKEATLYPTHPRRRSRWGAPRPRRSQPTLCPCRSPEKGEVPLRGVGTLRYLFHRMHLCNGSLMV